MSKHTPFYDVHLEAHARLVDFAGWEMPLHYGSQLKEHHEVRTHAGMFDVSHMGIVDIAGKNVADFLQRLLANDIAKLTPGKALYTCMLNEDGGVLDDLIIYKINQNLFRLVINAGTREKDLAWIKKQAQSFDVTINERSDLAMLAIQGPETKQRMASILPSQYLSSITQLNPFHFFMWDDWFVARTGYTGEEGYEFIFPKNQAIKIWNMCIASGIVPCGLGARDTLRLEAGFNLYGSDMDETVTPFESNLGWTVDMKSDRTFIGSDALRKQLAQGIPRQLVGLVLTSKGIIRNHQKVIIKDDGEGEVTSGGYSPTLETGIALARIPHIAADHHQLTCFVEMRGKLMQAQIIKPPFVKQGKKREY